MSGGRRGRGLVTRCSTIDRPAQWRHSVWLGLSSMTRILDSLEAAMHAKDPLAYLWREITNPDEGYVCNGPSSHQEVRIASKASLDLYAFNSLLDDTDIEAPSSSFAVAMDDGPIVDVMLPGCGFCRVDRGDIVVKKQRRPSANTTKVRKQSKLKTLLLDFKPLRGEDEPLDTKNYLPRLLKIVGNSVTSLSIIADDLDDVSLAASLEGCPQLESLSVGGMTLQSMDAISELYGRGIKLSSLDLHDLTIPIGNFDSFVKQLGSNNVLQHLRIGERWSERFRTTTAEAMQAALATNSSFRFVHLSFSDYFTGRPRDPLRKWNCQKFDKQPVSIPLDVRSRLAFLSALRSSPSNSAVASQLPEDSIA